MVRRGLAKAQIWTKRPVVKDERVVWSAKERKYACNLLSEDGLVCWKTSGNNNSTWKVEVFESL